MRWQLKKMGIPNIAFDVIFLIAICITGISFATTEEHHPAANSKCNKKNQDIPSGIDFPEIHLSQVVPLVTSRSLLLYSAEKPPTDWNAVNGTISVPNSLELLQFICSAKYKVQWGFESYPWITFNTWTGVIRPIYPNDTITYTAILEFKKVQETSLQSRIPICYSITDPCIQTAVEAHSGRSNDVELYLANGSHYAIQSISEKEQFGTNVNCTLKFGYDPESQKFYCEETDPSKSSKQIGKIFLRYCQDPVTCDSLYAKSKCNIEPSFPITDCTPENHCRTETAYAGKFPGIAVCHSGSAVEHSVAIPYFYTLAKPRQNSTFNRTKRYLNWNDVNPEDMLQLGSFTKPVFTKQKLHIYCNASYFYLGCGMYFDIFKEDTPDASNSDQINADMTFQRNQLESAKEILKYDEVNIGGFGGSKLPLIRSLEINDYVFSAPGTYDISCYAPVWNTTEWAKTSMKVIVKESMLPVFDGGNKTETLFYAPYKRLECFAYGMPKPELSWTRDGGTIPDEISLTIGEQNETLVWEVLTFPKLKYGIHGNFTCSASNVAGTVRKSIIIIPPDFSQKTSSTAMWFLVGLAILVTLLVPSILFLSWKVRSQRKHIEDLTEEEVDEFINGKPDYIPFQCDMSTYAYFLPYDTSYEIPRDSLEIDFNTVLGSGEYGLVLKGMYKNANPPNGGTPLVKPVAVKTTKPLANGKDYFKALLSELKIMTYIGSHTNIVTLIGACTQNIKKREVYIATEYCENGSLLAYLRMNRYAYENPLQYAELAHSRLSTTSAETSFIFSATDGMKPDLQYVKMEDLGNIALSQQYENIRLIKNRELHKWSYEIACGMEFLTSKKVIHGDLAARNVLLTRGSTAKISDFGLSRQLFHYNYYTKTAVTPLPLKWLAIECLQSFQFSAESDVWAYGVTVFEIFSIGEMPYSSVQMNGEQFLQALKQGMRLSKPAYAPREVFDLMMKCWKYDRKQRPNFTEIAKYFHTRLAHLSDDNSSRPTPNNSDSDLSSASQLARRWTPAMPQEFK